ncbi:MAG: hypothetical protein GF399_04035 [Candidatus Coatesbacteria bacterium]|nr:hypothetical protein [Candidatus Coatesbacteria bacterium]
MEDSERIAEKHPRSSRLDRTQDRLYKAVLERILELDPEEFEVLITELLATLGFEARHVGQVGDGGIDAVGTLDVYGMARIELHVQCKRYQLSSRINAKEIRDFRGAIPRTPRPALSPPPATPSEAWRRPTARASSVSAWSTAVVW